MEGKTIKQKNHDTQIFAKEDLYAVVLESMNTFETVFQRFAEWHKPLSYSGAFKDFSWINNIFSCSKGKDSVKEKPFAGFSFALSEADNPPQRAVVADNRTQPNKKAPEWVLFYLVGLAGFEPAG